MFKDNYFKGWYFKCCTEKSAVAFIPSYHCSGRRKTALLQIITDREAFSIPFSSLEYRAEPLFVKIGDCIFSRKGIKVNIHSNELDMKGTLHFDEHFTIGYDIMGPFKYIPFMQCRHSVYSMKYRIDGRISFNGRQLIFNNGTGYMEGDCGSSFPKRYIWTQCCFKGGSLMLSAADIPLFGFNFMGIIGVVMLNKKEYRIATYLGAEIKHIGKNTVIVKQGGYQLTAILIEKNPRSVYAPENGRMSRTIHESLACKAYYRFSFKEKILCEFISDRASFEFEY